MFYSLLHIITGALLLLQATSKATTKAPKPPKPRSSPNKISMVKGISTGGEGVGTVSQYRKALKKGYKFVAIRGYKEKWGNNPGGLVDPDLHKNWRNARKAGFPFLFLTWFPCSGTAHNCKSYTTQAQELVDYSMSHRLPTNRIFLDIEIDEEANNWDYGHHGNLVQAREMINALLKIAPTSGIKSSPGAWEQIFGSRTKIVNNKVPLWWMSWDWKDSREDLIPDPTFGGWNVSIAKEYAETSSSLPNLFQLSILDYTSVLSAAN